MKNKIIWRWKNMNTSGDAAESTVRMSLQGLEAVVRLSGSGAKNIAALLIAVLKSKEQTKGKTRLTNMLKSGKELKVFSVKQEDLKTFSKEAKRYGVLFCVLKEKQSIDGMVDIIVRAEDASKINRIVDRFNLRSEVSIKSEIEKGKADKDKGVVIKSVEEKLVDDILSKPISKEENEMSNPQVAKTEKDPLSEQDYKKSEMGAKSERTSVREELKSIKKEQEQKKQGDLDKTDNKKEKNKNTKHKQVKSKRKKNKKLKERG